MASIIGALDCGGSCHAPAIVLAASDVYEDGCGDTSDLEVHAPTAIMVQASSAHPAAIGCDLELVVSLVGVDPVAQVPRVTCADHGIRSIDALLVLITVVDQDTERSCRHNLTHHFIVTGCNASDLKVHAPATT
jgi:hypothetical protein